MLVLKSTHKALLQAKDEQLARLESEVAFLRSCIQPPERRTGHASFRLTTEANALLDGQQDQIELAAPAVDADVLAERDRIFGGNY